MNANEIAISKEYHRRKIIYRDALIAGRGGGMGGRLTRLHKDRALVRRERESVNNDR